MKDISTNAVNTWCPGCGDFSILAAVKSILQEDKSLSDTVIVSGIGCHAKIVDYLNVNSFYSLHGRAIPAAEGIKLANPKLKVIVFVGDGDSYGEGLEHLVFAAKRNIDITVIVHNNRIYGLTTGQVSPTSPKGFMGKSTPHGSLERPFNPLELTYASGATFIARGYSGKPAELKEIMKKAIKHKGFSHVDVLQVCKTFFDQHDYYDKLVYNLVDHDSKDSKKAFKKIIEWDYNTQAKIPLGVLYEKSDFNFDEAFKSYRVSQAKTDKAIKNIVKNSI
ncbi:2-oxoacid:ferredoxin oxidoreductase subunit beta [bacterium]|nr:2-oxoacid:ferredoxin oxidoreductase subunit beta [bacterium]